MSFIGILVFDILRFPSFTPQIESRDLNTWLFHDPRVVGGMIVFPVMMVVFYAISGFYNDVRVKSRLDDVRNSAVVGFVGMLVIYFIILINDYLNNRVLNYELLLVLWLCLMVPVLLGRMMITGLQRRKLRAAGGCYTAVVIGSKESAAELRRRLTPRHQRAIPRFRILGELSPEHSTERMAEEISQLRPDALLVTSHPEGVGATTELITRLYPLNTSIYITPDLYQLLTSRARLTDVVGEPLIDITNAKVSASTTNLKRLADIAGATLALIGLSPVMAAISLAVKLDSKGPVFYTQERIGYHKRPFRIIKFRTMAPHSEPNGPALSTENDHRITRVGHFLRKYRLDELPQFWNVIKGEMSLVGPRPERRYFIEQIEARVPQYSLIHQVRPGITSWGMVKYGYASNVDEMVERLYYDLLYIDNVSFSVDLKIIFHTINTVLTGKGV